MIPGNSKKLEIAIVSIHPLLLEAYLGFGNIKSACQKDLARITILNLRRFSGDKHGSVDAPAYGGGEGMVLRPEPLARVVNSFRKRPKVVLMSPVGSKWTQDLALAYSKIREPLLFICGRFSGVDQRFIDKYVDDTISIGDFVVSGGELPALLVIDSILRNIPGVLGDELSPVYDSFSPGMNGLLEYPLYTRPRVFEDLPVPQVLLSGNHKQIQQWRDQKSLECTAKYRADLLKKNDKV